MASVRHCQVCGQLLHSDRRSPDGATGVVMDGATGVATGGAPGAAVGGAMGGATGVAVGGGGAMGGAPGAAVGGGGACPNRWCRRRDRGFSVAFSVGVYTGALRRAIGRFKYRGQKELAPVFAAMVARYLGARPVWFEEFDVITSVPAYTGPGARRDWDPVGAVVAELPARLGAAWAVEPGLVVKTRETPGMAGLGWAQRQAVARGPLRAALAVGERQRVDGARVLVLDDVLTEGSTLREVAGVLRQAGASDVAGLVLARRAWGAEPPAARPSGAAM